MLRRSMLLIAGSSAMCVGCDALSALVDALLPRVVTVELVNDGDFSVEGSLFYDDDQDTIEALLTQTGTERPFIVPAGGISSFSVRCDDLQAIILDDADLRVVGGVGPSASTDVLRDGSDFHCGDTIVFTFDHSALIVDFDVTVTTRSAP